MKHRHSLLVGSLILCSTGVQAGGLYLYENSSTNVGLASAGEAALANDASVLGSNPAGLSHVAGQSFSGSLIGLYGDTDLDNYSNGRSENIIGFTPLGSAFYSDRVDDKLSVGIGLYGNYGLSLDYDNLFNKVDIPKVTTQAITLKPAMSYRLNDQWSLGAALGFQFGVFEVEGQLHGTEYAKNVKDNDTQVNGQLGVLYEPSVATRFGLAYTSETKLKFTDVGQEAIMPQILTFSAFHRISPNWNLLGNLNWQDWSRYHTTFNADTQDTYQIAIGAQYVISPDMTWNMGLAFDSSMFKDQDHADLTISTGDAYRIGTGVDFKWSDKSRLNLAFEATLIESSQTNLTGTPIAGFKDPTLYFFSMQYTWSNL
ncbi:outer membrane protein transport protein [Shewanella sp. A25]|nr:outer membrane protein transport protein [Shewanella shenzhenensis]